MPSSRTQHTKTSFLTVRQSRLVDEIAIHRFGMLGLVLMENAGRGAADVIGNWVEPNSKIVVLCGTGNNGGDGLVIARHLHWRGLAVSVWIVGDRARMAPDALANLLILEKTDVPCHWLGANLDTTVASILEQVLSKLSQCNLIVDAMLGTGSKGELRGTFAILTEASNQSMAIRVAIDIPTGLNAQTGDRSPFTFRADHTLTFVAAKVGLCEADSAPFVGQLHVLPIGIPPEVMEIVFSDTTKESGTENCYQDHNAGQ